MTIYLAGPIQDCSPEECNDWRSWVKEKFPHHTYLDPMRRAYMSNDPNSVSKIVEGDKEDIRKSDLVIAHCSKPSVGTSMEIIYATIYGIPVIVIIPEGKPVSPWIRYHCEQVLSSLEDLYQKVAMICSE